MGCAVDRPLVPLVTASAPTHSPCRPNATSARLLHASRTAFSTSSTRCLSCTAPPPPHSSTRSRPRVRAEGRWRGELGCQGRAGWHGVGAQQVLSTLPQPPQFAAPPPTSRPTRPLAQTASSTMAWTWGLRPPTRTQSRSRACTRPRPPCWTWKTAPRATAAPRPRRPRPRRRRRGRSGAWETFSPSAAAWRSQPEQRGRWRRPRPLPLQQTCSEISWGASGAWAAALPLRPQQRRRRCSRAVAGAAASTTCWPAWAAVRQHPHQRPRRQLPASSWWRGRRSRPRSSSRNGGPGRRRRARSSSR